MPTHSILGGKVSLYRRDDGGENWFCSTYFKGKNLRKSTKTDSLPHAEEIAEGWYLELRGKDRAGLLQPTGKTFDQAADAFENEYEIITEGERSPKWVEEHRKNLRLHLRPFFGKLTLGEIDADKVQEYRIKRAGEPARQPQKKKSAEPAKQRSDSSPANAAQNEEEKKPKHPARNTINNEIITLRLVLKTALRKKWMAGLPDLSPPYKRQMKIVHRPWFSPEEYKVLYAATRDYKNNPLRERYRWDAEQLHDYVLFMANTGLRPDEAANLEHRDVTMVKDKASSELILEIEIRGKRGIGVCKSRPDAVKPYQRLLNRPKWTAQGRTPRSKKALAAAEQRELPTIEKPKQTDKVFPGNHIKLFNKILDKKHTNLKFDRDGKPRTAYSLRHYYICQRLIEGADIYQIAKNCRTSVDMIEKHYAAHIMNTLDASEINTRRLRRRSKSEPARMD